MIVFPAIDIQNGHAVRLRQGVKDDSTTYFSRTPSTLPSNGATKVPCSSTSSTWTAPFRAN